MSDVLTDIDVVVDAPVIDAPEPEVKAPEPEIKAEAKPEPKAEPESRSIPLAAHLEERRQHREELDRERAERKALEARLAKLESPPPPPAVEPQFMEDPKGYVDHRVQSALDKLNGVEKKITETGKTAEEVAAETRYNRFMGDLQATEVQFTKTTPDYNEALNHLRQARAAEIRLQYPNVTEQQLIDGIRQEELGMAHQLMQAGRNPHEVAYQLAKARGYAPKAAVPPLPEVKAPAQLPPDQTLGTGAGSPNAGENFIPDGEEFDLAMKQVFRGRRQA